MPWRLGSPRTRMPTPKWQPCLSRGLSRGDTLITSPISTWPSSGLNHQRHRSAGTLSHVLGEDTGTLRPLTAKQLVGRRETFEKGLPSTCDTRRSRLPNASWLLCWNTLIHGSPSSSAWQPCALLFPSPTRRSSPRGSSKRLPIHTHWPWRSYGNLCTFAPPWYTNVRR